MKIAREVARVQRESKYRVSKLYSYPDENIGLEIVHLFVLDILGRDTRAANIFSNKCDEDFKKTKAVSWSSKALASAVLVLINCFFIYYAMIKGYVKGIEWQRAYLSACVIQFVMEIFLIESIECLWINYMVPSLVAAEVTSAMNQLNDAINRVCSTALVDSRFILNVPHYLHVSYQIATEFPSLLESVIVKSYHNYLPGELCNSWRYSFNNVPNSVYSLRNIAVFATLMTMMQTVGTLPFIFQRIFIRLTQPIILAGFAIAFMAIITSPLYLGLISGLIVIIIAYYVRRQYFNKKQLQKQDANVAPIDDVMDDDYSVEGLREEQLGSVGFEESKDESDSKITPIIHEEWEDDNDDDEDWEEVIEEYESDGDEALSSA